MIDIDEINAEIDKLEAQVQTYQSIEKLAALYTVRDHQRIGASTVQLDAKTPFLTLCNGEPMCEIMTVMDELMSTIQAMYPQLYDAVMLKLQK